MCSECVGPGKPNCDPYGEDAGVNHSMARTAPSSGLRLGTATEHLIRQFSLVLAVP